MRTKEEWEELEAMVRRDSMRHLAGVCLDVAKDEWGESPGFHSMTSEELDSYVFDRVEAWRIEAYGYNPRKGAHLRAEFDRELFLQGMLEMLLIHYYEGGELDIHGLRAWELFEGGVYHTGADASPDDEGEVA